MKWLKICRIVSLACSLTGFVLAGVGLISGLSGARAEGLDGITAIFILPSLAAFVMIGLDYLILIHVIKKGLIYSCFSSGVKLFLAACLLPGAIREWGREIRMEDSNFDFYLFFILMLILIAIPSIFNITKYCREQKGKMKTGINKLKNENCPNDRKNLKNIEKRLACKKEL